MEYLISLMILLCWMPLQIRADACNCDGINAVDSKDVYLCGDKRLGPVHLPTGLPNLNFEGYDRFSGLTPKAFLDNYWDDKAIPKPKWKYPPKNGFLLDLDGNPIKGYVTLLPKTRVDRFGTEHGTYISAFDAPFTQRALSPESLNNATDVQEYPSNYHVYEVITNLTVVGGPIAPAFGQTGLGAQFDTEIVGNIQQLVEWKFLKRLTKADVDTSLKIKNVCDN